MTKRKKSDKCSKYPYVRTIFYQGLPSAVPPTAAPFVGVKRRARVNQTTQALRPERRTSAAMPPKRRDRDADCKNLSAQAQRRAEGKLKAIYLRFGPEDRERMRESSPRARAPPPEEAALSGTGLKEGFKHKNAGYNVKKPSKDKVRPPWRGSAAYIQNVELLF